MKQVLLTGVYNNLEMQKLDGFNLVTSFLITYKDDGLNYQILTTSTELDKEGKIVSTSVDDNKYKIDSQFFDNSLHCLNCLSETNPEFQMYARMCFEYIIFDVFDDSMNYTQVSAKVIK